MARPKGRNTKPVNLTLPPSTKAKGAKLAFKRGVSLSQLVAQLLDERIAAESRAA